MKDKNILLILAVILAFFAAWRIFSYRASHGEKNPAVVDNVQQAISKSAELFEEKPIRLSQPIDSTTLRNTAQQNTPSSTLTDVSATDPSVKTQAKSSSSTLPNKTYNGNNTRVSSSSTPTGSNRYSPTEVKNSSRQNSSSSSAAATYTPSAADQMGQARANNLSPYSFFNKEAKQKLDNDFNNLSTAISRAVQNALMPKSKKDANIEKYLHKGSSTPASEDPFQDMLTQFANTKNDIVKSVSNAFGKEAGQQAGQLLDNFQRDLTTEVAKKDQDPQTTVQNVQKIAQKYQQKFDQMNQENQYKQYVKELTAQYKEQLESLKTLYPDQEELNNQFTRISNEALKKEIALSSKNMDPEEYMKARYTIQYDMQKETEDAIRKAGVSAAKFHEYDAARRKKTLEELEKAGKIVSVPRRESAEKTNALSETLLKEQTDMLAQVEKAYGTQARANFKQVLDDYYQQVMQTMNEEMTETDRFEAQRRLLIDSNRRILELQKEEIQKMPNIPSEQKEAALQKIDQEINALLKM